MMQRSTQQRQRMMRPAVLVRAGGLHNRVRFCGKIMPSHVQLALAMRYIAFLHY